MRRVAVHAGWRICGYSADFAPLAARQSSNAQAGHSPCLCIGALRANVLICRVPRVLMGQSGWRSVMVVAGGSARARVSARRSASGSRYHPAMRRTRSAASTAGIPAAVTNNGRTEDPRTTGTAWVAVRNLAAQHDLAPPEWAEMRVLQQPWFPAELEIQRADALVWAPAAFRKHGVYLSARDLEAA